jgi:hypothetical protein
VVFTTLTSNINDSGDDDDDDDDDQNQCVLLVQPLHTDLS